VSQLNPAASIIAWLDRHYRARGLKLCSGPCNKMLAFSAYYRVRHNPDGLSYACILCSRARRRVTPLPPTRCTHGHPLTAANTITSPQGRRQCRICRRRDNRSYRSRVKLRRGLGGSC
jgi:hypothetical protein